MNQLDNENRGVRALGGMKDRVSEGRWCWTAPIGYITGGKSRTSLVPDPERAALIARLFDLVSSRQFTPKTALDEVTAMGLRTKAGKRVSPETLGHILRNPIYYGRIEIRKWAISVQGDFPPLISSEMFFRVQAVLSGQASVAAPRPTSREDFPLRGSVLCTLCRKPVTGSFSKGKLGRHYGYYRCFRASGHLNEPKDRVEAAFVELLERLQPRAELMALIERIFQQVWTKKHSSLFDEAAALRNELAKLEAQRKTVLDQLKGGYLVGDDFKQVNESIRSQLEEVRMRMSLAQSSELDLATALDYLRYQFWNTHILWQESDLAGKIRLQRALSPHGIVWESEGLGTPTISFSFRGFTQRRGNRISFGGPGGIRTPNQGIMSPLL